MGAPKTQWSMFGMAWEIAAIISIPLIGLALLGRLVDRVFGSSPIFFLIGAAIAMLISGLIVWMKFSKLMNDIDV